MAEQFQVTQQEVAYAPQQATDFVREFDRHIAERDAMNKPYEASVRARSRQAVEDANKQVQEMEQLAKLSKSLTNKLVKIQEQANEEQYAQGLADALMEDPSLFGQAELEVEEAKLAAGQEVATQTSKQYLAEGGSEANAREIRNTGGWYGYGRFVGQLQMLGDNYGAALEEAKTDFTANINGQELTYGAIQTKDEYNAWTRAFNSQYLRGVPRTNGEVVEKYVLREMRAQSKADRAKWTREYNEQREAEEAEVRDTQLVQDIKRGDTGIAERAFATYPGSFREIREELEKNLLSNIDAGRISTNDAINFYQNQTVIKDGKRVTMAEAFPKQFGLFQDEVQKALTKEDNEVDAAKRSAAKELERTLNSSDTRLNNQQIAEIMTSPNFRNNPVAQQILNNYLTTEELDDIGSKAYLDDMYRSGNLTTAVLSKFPNHLRQEYASKAEQTDAISADYNGKEVLRQVRGHVRTAMSQSVGDTPSTDDLEFQKIEKNALAIHEEVYNEARRSGYTHEEAMKVANERLTVEAEQYVKLRGESALGGNGPDLPDISTSKAKVTQARKFISQHGINTTPIPGSEADYETAKEYLRTKKGTMPGFFTALAAGQPYTAEQLVLKQAELRGDTEFIEKVKKSPYTQQQQALPPEIKRLTVVDQNPRTFAQAAVRTNMQGGDIKYFLDVVASKESEGSGGYDAYNLGGSAGGHRAHGSGNSATNGYWDKPISQMTIGEIKRLHAQGRIHAVGRYQFIAPTFLETAARAGFSDDTVFGPQVQDQFALTRLIQRASWGNLQTGLGKEWIGLQYLPQDQYNRLVQLGQKLYEENK